MAKLNVHGCKLITLERWMDLSDCRVRVSIAVMQDGVVLSKDDYYRDGKRAHGSGWKRAAVTLRPVVKVNNFTPSPEQTKAFVAKLETSGYAVSEAISDYV